MTGSIRHGESRWLMLMSALSIVPLWIVDYLPMLDLPQHAAQVTALLQYRDAATGYQELFELNFFTPYLLGYAVLALTSLLVGIVSATKLVLALVFVLNVVLMRRLLDEFGGDRALAWLVLPAN